MAKHSRAPGKPVFYILKHKPTGVTMPDKRGRAGGTYVDPFKPRLGGQTKTPRLFARSQDAASALDWWAKGRVQVIHDFSGEYGPEITGHKPVEGRNADEWEIVPVQLVEVEG